MDIDSTDPSTFLSLFARNQTLSNQDIDTIKEIQNYYDHKLWHPLTLHLLNFFQSVDHIPVRMSFYEHVVKSISTFIQPVSLVKLAILTSETLESSEAEIFFSPLFEHKAIISDPAAHSLLITQLSLKILETNKPDAIKIATKNAQESATLIEGIPCIDVEIFANHWLLTATIAKLSNNRNSYYHDAIKYIEAVDIHTLSLEDRLSWSTTIGVAALTAPDIFYFGDFLNSRAFIELKKSTTSPTSVNIGSLLENMECGRALESISLLQTLHDVIIPLSEISLVMEKISLMSITHLLFQRSFTGGSRLIQFDEIATASNISLDKVEFALMKLVSQKLVKGLIDETTQTFKYSWVHPRSLTKANCTQLALRFSQWFGHAKTTLNEMQDTL